MAANVEMEAVEYDSEYEDMDDDNAPTDEAVPAPKLRSAITGGEPSTGGAAKKTKGRGFRDESSADRNTRFAGRDFDSLASESGPGPQRSIEGWIVLVTGVNEEAQEDDLQNAFGEFGQVKNLHLNLDRRTGYVKGYALIEYEAFEEAKAAIETLNETPLLAQTIHVDWAFSSGSTERRNARRRSPRAHRSRTPPRRRY